MILRKASERTSDIHRILAELVLEETEAVTGLTYLTVFIQLCLVS